jgi:hypothetical protein
VRDLPFIQALYIEIDGELEAQRSTARTNGDANAVTRIEAKQRINDQAYFVLCWGQLETAIDDACRAAMRSRQSSGNWAIRRAWDLYNPDDNRLSGLRFEDRAVLVLDRSAGPGSPWAKVMGYYALRNQIAHGDLQAERIDVDEVVKEFFQIQAALQS